MKKKKIITGIVVLASIFALSNGPVAHAKNKQNQVRYSNTNQMLENKKRETIFSLIQLSSMNKLSVNDYNFFVGKIQSARSLSSLNEIIKELDNLDKTVENNAAHLLEDKKTEAIRLLIQLISNNKLSNNDYNYFISLVQNERSLTNLNLIVEELNGLDKKTEVSAAQLLEDKKSEAIRLLIQVLSSGTLSDSEYNNFIMRIQNATSIDAIDSIIKELR